MLAGFNDVDEAARVTFEGVLATFDELDGEARVASDPSDDIGGAVMVARRVLVNGETTTKAV